MGLAKTFTIQFNSILFTLITTKYNIFYSKKKIKRTEHLLNDLLSTEEVRSGQRSKAFVLATTSAQLNKIGRRRMYNTG